MLIEYDGNLCSYKIIYHTSSGILGMFMKYSSGTLAS